MCWAAKSVHNSYDFKIFNYIMRKDMNDWYFSMTIYSSILVHSNNLTELKICAQYVERGTSHVRECVFAVESCACK